MRIKRSEIIAGIPAMEARDIARLFKKEGNFVSADYMTTKMKIKDVHQVESMLKALTAEGFLEENDEGYFLTLKGSALALASANGAITKAKAEKELADLLSRIKEINESPDYPLRVGEIIVFGSYLSETNELSDIDIGFLVSRREDISNEEYVELSDKRVKIALDKGRRLQGFDDLFWPLKEITLLLKSGRSCLSLHNLSHAEERAFIESRTHKVLLKL